VLICSRSLGEGHGFIRADMFSRLWGRARL
jgi:hypothetical protein